MMAKNNERVCIYVKCMLDIRFSFCIVGKALLKVVIVLALCQKML